MPYQVSVLQEAEIAQLGERQTEDLPVPGSIPGFGIFFSFINQIIRQTKVQSIKSTKKWKVILVIVI